MKKFSGTLVIVFLFICFNTISVMAAPTTISPGNSQFRVSVSECCPTFSWAAVEGAEGYELAVFAIWNSEQIISDTLYDELLQISDPSLTMTIPAPALSWTPTKEQGLTPGQTYAWHIRSLNQSSPGEWSNAAFFKVPETTISNLDTAINEAVTDFLTDDAENFTFWSGLEERIGEIVTDKITESSTPETAVTAASATDLRTGSEGETKNDTNVWYGYAAAEILSGWAETYRKYTEDNVFIGRYAGANTFDSNGYRGADFNVFVGNGCGYTNTIGSSNSFFGFNSGHKNMSGSNNSFFGKDSGKENTGSNNAFFGGGSGYKNTSGANNSFFGQGSGHENTTGRSNAFFGQNSGYFNTTGYDNTFFGNFSGNSNITGSNNAFFGLQAGFNNTAGINNAFFGKYSGHANTTGNFNAFFGNESGYKNTTGFYNAFFGQNSGQSNTTGYRNAFFGQSSGNSNTDGKFNAFFGNEAGKANTTGIFNTFFGYASGYKNITGNSNTFFGNAAGNSNTEGDGNVFVGYEAGFYETGSNKLYISNSSSLTPLIYGDFKNRQLKINGTLEFTNAFATSDQRWKKDIKPLDNSLSKIQQLDGKSYLWRRDEFPDKGFSDQPQIGLIAQEVEKVIPEIVQTDEKGFKSISYTQLIPLLIEGMKEQQIELEAQQREINLLKESLKKLLQKHNQDGAS